MKILPGLLGALLLAPFATAADFPEEGMPAAARVHAWTDLTESTLPDFKSEGAWPREIPAQSGGNAAVFGKTAGAGGALRMGIYSGAAGYHGPLSEKLMSGEITAADLRRFKAEDFRNLGTFRVQVAPPLENLRRVVFQIRVSGISPGKDLTAFQLIETLFPITLTLDSSANPLSPVTKTLVSRGMVNGFFEEIWSYEWVLPAGSPAAAFAVNWTTYPHSVLTGLRLIEIPE